MASIIRNWGLNEAVESNLIKLIEGTYSFYILNSLQCVVFFNNSWRAVYVGA